MKVIPQPINKSFLISFRSQEYILFPIFKLINEYIRYINSKIESKMLEYSQLYKQQQLERIDSLIEDNMDQYLDLLVSNKIQSMLSQQIMKYQHATSSFSSLSYEENICQLFNQLCQRSDQKEQVYREQIDQEIRQKEENIVINNQKQGIIGRLKEEISRITTQFVRQNQQKNQLYANNFVLNQQIINLKQTLTKQLAQKQTINENLQIKLNERQIELKDQIQRNEQLILQNIKLKQSQYNYENLIEQLQECLSEDVQKYKLSLITNHILINELNQSYQDKIKELAKYAKIHQQNKELVCLIQNIKGSFKVNLVDIEKYELESNFLNICQEKFFDGLNDDFKGFASRLSKNSQVCHRIAQANKQMQQSIIQKEQKIIQLKTKQEKILQNLEKYINQNQLMKQMINKHQNQHYNTLVDMQKNKRKIQGSLLQNLHELKRIQQKYALLEQQNQQKGQKINNLQSKLCEMQEQKQSLIQQCKQKQKIVFELKQQILNMKSNLDIMMKTQQDDQDSNFNIVQQLIDKNNELNNQMTTKKIQMDLKQQKINYQQKIIQQSAQQIEHLTQQIERLNDNFKQLEIELQIQQKECKVSHQQIQILQLQIEQFKQKEAEKALRVFIETEIQTDQIQHTLQSRIKKQIITQPQKNQVQKSHSLLSQRNQSKQNMSNKANLISNRQKQNYKQKIITLNQIINYMLNYAKGYECGEIRLGSWFSNQIEKYGTQYELRILDPNHLEPKIKNIKFIQRLCKQDSTCNKLIKEFESILEFYFNRASKLSTSSLSITPITQQKLNKTVNKSKNPLNKYNF